MPRLPKYRNKNSYGHCRILGTDYYFGKHQKQPPKAYWDLIARYKSGELLAATVGKASPVVESHDPDTFTIAALIDQFLDHAKAEYTRQDGTLGSEYDNYRQALRPLFSLFADELARDFSPKKLNRLQEHAIKEFDWCRTNANKQFSRIKTVFRWAVSEELVDANVFHALQTVRAVKPGRFGVRETERIEMVADAIVEQTLIHLRPVIADMVRVHRLIGGRSQDICNLRWSDIDRKEPAVWLYHPPKHKQAWRGHIRTLYIEAEAQAILLKYVHRPAESFIFSPAESEELRRKELHEIRRTPLSCGNRPGTNRAKKPLRTVGDRYTPDVYRRAITRGCELAFPCPRLAELNAVIAALVADGHSSEKARKFAALNHPRWVQEIRKWNREHHWFPHQLRHAAATAFADAAGLEYSRMRLGHRHVRTTELYRTIQDEAVIRKIKELKDSGGGQRVA